MFNGLFLFCRQKAKKFFLEWKNSGSGYRTTSFTINATTPPNSNYSIFYRQNNTGDFVLLASNLVGDQTINIAGTKYQDTDLRIQLFGNGTATPKIYRVKFNTQNI